jgi:hypothetical protein
MSICNKTNTNLLHTNLLHTNLLHLISRKIGHIIQIVHETSAKKNPSEK